MSRYLELCTLGDLPPRQGVPAGVIMAGMVPVTRLFADQDGHARFEDVEIPLAPDDPPPDAMSICLYGTWRRPDGTRARGIFGTAWYTQMPAPQP